MSSFAEREINNCKIHFQNIVMTILTMASFSKQWCFYISVETVLLICLSLWKKCWIYFIQCDVRCCQYNNGTFLHLAVLPTMQWKYPSTRFSCRKQRRKYKRPYIPINLDVLLTDFDITVYKLWAIWPTWGYTYGHAARMSPIY